MNDFNRCTATFNNIILQYEGRGFSRATSAKKQAQQFSARTLEEFDRYYQSRPGYAGYKPPVAKAPTARAQANAAKRPVSPVRTAPAEQKRAAQQTAKKPMPKAAKLPSQVKNEPSKVRRAVEKIADVSIGATKRNFRRLPAATLVTIVACMMSLVLLVGSTVMTGDITNQYSELKSEVNALANQESKLSTELDIKNDLRVIEDIAINKLGMVSRDLITRNYIKLDEEDMVESFAEPETNVGLSTLLSAIAGR
ncbi:MAG: cell division protein FtsL [Clostridia bacterium]|nr:cell division protein FtsL [Clostridia bacterium]